MPANIGDITSYHLEEAARHRALAQAARDRGCLAEAAYQDGMAARWEEAARQQVTIMQPLPRRTVTPRPIYSTPKTTYKPFSVVCWLAAVRGLKRISALLHPSIFKPSIPLHVVPPR
jgi:hypothetical protein